MWQALIPMLTGAAMGGLNSIMGKKRNTRSIAQGMLQGGMGGMGMGGMGFGGMDEMGGNSSMGGGGLSNAFLQNFMRSKMGGF